MHFWPRDMRYWQTVCKLNDCYCNLCPHRNDYGIHSSTTRDILMNDKFISLISGVIFGIGLVISGMTNPEKVIGFLSITHNWDASLIFVMGGGVNFR